MPDGHGPERLLCPIPEHQALGPGSLSQDRAPGASPPAEIVMCTWSVPAGGSRQGYPHGVLKCNYL